MATWFAANKTEMRLHIFARIAVTETENELRVHSTLTNEFNERTEKENINIER